MQYSELLQKNYCFTSGSCCFLNPGSVTWLFCNVHGQADERLAIFSEEGGGDIRILTSHSLALPYLSFSRFASL